MLAINQEKCDLFETKKKK